MGWPRVPRIECKCPECGRVTLHIRSQIKRKAEGIRCCSRECFNKQRAARPLGSVEDRFWAKVKKTKRCWLWTGYRTQAGYGQIRMPGRARSGRLELAHRFSWIISNGPIPEGAEILHNCPGGDNPACVNPAHLMLGTHADNMADAGKKKQMGYGENHCHAVITKGDVREIRRIYAAGGITQERLGAQFGVTGQHVSGIVLRKFWKHVD